jgi:hypothetical protein
MSDPNPHIAAGDPHAQSHGVTPAADHGHAPAPANFTDAEWAVLQAEDFAAGKAVVMLMLGIFLTGVALYSIVAVAVMS